MEVTKKLITWYADEKTRYILDHDPYDAFEIVSVHFAESFSSGNYSDEEILKMIEEDELIPFDDVKQYGYKELGEI